MKDKVQVGKVSRLHGFKGELSLKLVPEYKTILDTLDYVYVEIDQKAIPFFIDSLRYTAQGYALVFFEGVDSEAMAKRLRSRAIYVNQDAIPEDMGTIGPETWVGFEVHDENHGPIGQVESFIDNGAGGILLIDHDGEEVLIPVHEDIIVEVDEERASIQIEAPEGLIELNLDS